MNKDIEALALKHGQEKLSVMRPNGMGQQMMLYGYDFTKAELKAFAKALQGDVEPVAWMFKGAGIVSFGEMSEMPPRAIGAVKDATIYKLYTSPPNTSAKLDKAIEALNRIASDKVIDSQGRKLVLIAQEVLKELE